MHKEDCPWKDGYSESLTARDLGGPDPSLRISDGGISYSSNEWTTNDDDYYINFNFCPMCGVKL